MKKLIFVFLFALMGLSQTAQAQEQFIAEIRLFAGNFAPRGWAFCHGQILPIAQYTALFSLLGTTYGGNGQTTFALPDLRSRVAIHQGQGPGLSSYSLGEQGGTETNTLNASQLPVAAPSLNARNEVGNTDDPTNAVLAKPSNGVMIYRSGTSANVNMNAASISGLGGGQPVNNIQPYLGLNYIICLEGIYPSRP